MGTRRLRLVYGNGLKSKNNSRLSSKSVVLVCLQNEKGVKALYTNIFKDEMRGAYLFGASVLYTPHLIPREDVPFGWYCYDLRGTVKEPDVLYAMVDNAPDENRLASVLSYLP